MLQLPSQDIQVVKQQAFEIQKQCVKLSEMCPGANICFLFLTEGKFNSFQTPNAWPIRVTDIAGTALNGAETPPFDTTASQPNYTQAQAQQPRTSCSEIPRLDSTTLGDAPAVRHVYGPGGIEILSSDTENSPASSPSLPDEGAELLPPSLHKTKDLASSSAPDDSHTRESHDPGTITFPLTATEHSPESSVPREQRRPHPGSRGRGLQVISGNERHHYGLGSRPS